MDAETINLYWEIGEEIFRQQQEKGCGVIAIELKIGEFEEEYTGKMQLYLMALGEQAKLPDENPSSVLSYVKVRIKPL